MNDDLALTEEDVFTFPISDEAIEAAAGNRPNVDTMPENSELCWSCYNCATWDCPPLGRISRG